MCAAVDKDYVDGTLSDYFAGLSLRGSWGEEVSKKAEAGIQPARALLAAEKQESWPEALGPSARPSCRKLESYVDDVE